MSFLHSAFTENTQEAREWLENLGYSGLGFYQTKPFLYSSFSERANINRRWQELWYATEAYELITDNKIVDCRGNFELFKAVTALRDDSDHKQWFKIPKPEFNKHEFSTHTLLEIDSCTYLACSDMDKVSTDCGAHKATLEELIEHFKTKKV